MLTAATAHWRSMSAGCIGRAGRRQGPHCASRGSGRRARCVCLVDTAVTVRGHPRGSKFVPLNSWGRVSY